MTEAIERAARAAFNTKWGEEYTYSEEDRAYYEPLARTVIKSLLSLDEGMIEAMMRKHFGSEIANEDDERDNCIDIFTAAILCALGRVE